MPEVTSPIFTADQVASINGYQACGMFHPFTCGNSHDGERVLKASVSGLSCPTCDYIQDWVHGFMGDWSWKKAVEQSPLHKFLAERLDKDAK